MKRRIETMTDSELGQLFPIEIVPYDEQWQTLFKTEQGIIYERIGENVALSIEHFGSTAVKGLASKPTIDILVEIPVLTIELKDRIIEKMKSIDYHFIWRTDDEVPYMMFVKGYSLEGEKAQTFHVHMADFRHSLWDRLYFRDYLKVNPDISKEYETLKKDLATKHRFNREDYTRAKTDFILRLTEIAKKEYLKDGKAGE